MNFVIHFKAAYFTYEQWEHLWNLGHPIEKSHPVTGLAPLK